MKPYPPLLRSAVASSDGTGDTDAGYLAMVWGLFVWTGATIVTVITGSVIAFRSEFGQAAAIIQATGIALGAEATAYATMLGAVGFFRFGDKPHAALPQPPGTITTTTGSTEVVKTEAALVPAAVPLKVAVVDMPPSDGKPKA